MPQTSPLRQKSYVFARHVVAYCQTLYDVRQYVLGKQLLKSGTSIGANIEEATCAQSKDDFISKLPISLKEASESDYWLRLLIDSQILQEQAIVLRKELNEILRMLTASLNTLKGNQNRKIPL